MNLMEIARRVQLNLERVGVTAKLETENGVVFVRGVDPKGELRRAASIDARSRGG
jgi:hypothetical protein